jgi:hypothetical protein
MKLIKNFEEFIDESLQTEELPCVVGGIETDENIQIIDADTVDRNVIQ